MVVLGRKGLRYGKKMQSVHPSLHARKGELNRGHDFSFSSARTRIDSRSVFQMVEILCEAKNESLVVIHQRAVS